MRCRNNPATPLSLLLLTATLALPAPLNADNTAEARDLIDAGDYASALLLLENDLTSNNLATGTANALAAEAHYMLGNRSLAAEYADKAMAKGIADAYLIGGKLAFEAYDLDTAKARYAKYIALKNKAKKPIDPEASEAQEAIALAEDMLERVEQIVVIDRIDVDKDSFFEAYNLSSSAGQLRDANTLPISAARTVSTPYFESEDGDYRIWAQSSDIDADFTLMEQSRLIGNGWDDPTPLAGDIQIENGDAAYPFLMADGITLYFASNGEGSIGGYDIFRSNKDSETGLFQAPVNMGMPYNSPADDYMLAIDEYIGLGWWATDRNHLPDGKISVYVFIPSETRKNCDVDSPDIISLARLDDISVTQTDPDADYSELRAIARKSKSAGTKAKTSEFNFPVGSGKIYTRMSDFRSSEARGLMKQYLTSKHELDLLKSKLNGYRRQYALSPSSALSSQILEAEKELEQGQSVLNRLRGKVIDAERSNR